MAVAPTRETARPLPSPSTASEADPTATVLSRNDLSAYHGWLKYLRFVAKRWQQSSPQQPEQLEAAERRLREWSQRILTHPNLLYELRGVHEWAYESPVDGSGQPFRLNVPLDYDGDRAWPLALLLHGYSGNHLEHSTDMQAHAGYFEASVLGRSRGAGFRGLGEADVLHVLEYLQRHFNIDERRVHLAGGSMGGEGSYWLASRYPDRFASVRAACGWATDVPLGNLLTVPSYAVHSDDDFAVPVLMMRGPAHELQRLGAAIVYEEVTGYGHAVWLHQEAAQRALHWSQTQQLPLVPAQRRIDFTALDGSATGAYWARISEWGPRPRPARMQLEAKADNELHAEFDNVTSVTLELATSPFDAKAPLRLTVGGKPHGELTAPLPASIRLTQAGDRFAFEPLVDKPTARQHTPGGAQQLYDGRPLLIVYGTGGSALIQQAMLELARVASLSSSAGWSSASKDKGPEGVPHNQNLYGALPYQADKDTSAEDIATHHVILIGNASHNHIAQTLAPHLPVSMTASEIMLADGSRFPTRDHALGLVYKNPAAPERLLYWIAAEDAAGYDPNGLIPKLMSKPTAADLVITESKTQSLLTTRAFDNHWVFASAGASLALPAALKTRKDLALSLTDALRRSNHADFALMGFYPKLSHLPLPSATLHLSQLSQLFYFDSMGVLTLTGRELVRVHQRFQGTQEAQLVPTPPAQDIQDDRKYTVAVLSEQLWLFSSLTRLVPSHFRMNPQPFAHALSEHGLAAANP